MTCMKRIAVTSLAITLLVALASWETITAVTNVPHENPSTAETRFDIALPCLLRYGDILGMIAEKNYPQAKLLLEQLKIDYAHLPEELAFIMGRYNELIAQLSSRLDTLDNVLNECEVLLSQNKLQEAHPKLGEAKSFIDEAAELVEDVGKATDELAAHLAPLISPQEVETTNQAKARLLKAIAKLKEMEAWYRNKLENLATITGEKEELSSTELTLDVNPVEVWVGNTITATGILKTEENTYLAAKSIFVLLDGKHSTTITTTEDGSYRVIFDIPYHYIPEMIAQASYVPEGEDVNSFLASSSSAKKIKILFHLIQ